MVMCAAQFLSQQSCDLSIYLPSGINNIEDAVLYQSADHLIRSLHVDLAHRNDSTIFVPIIDDSEASSFLSEPESISDSDEHFNNYRIKQSRVVPHFPNRSKKSTINIGSPLSPSRNNRIDIIQKFLVFDTTTGRERRPLLHEFIRLLLENDEYSHIAEYIDRRQDIFKLHKPKEVSELWKRVKGRNSDNKMTYDKLARAIRYYYSSGIIISNPGRFTFRFGSKCGFGETWWSSYA